MIKGDFEITEGKERVERQAKKEKITIEQFHSQAEFSSPEVAIKGEKHEYEDWANNWRGIKVVSFRERGVCLRMWAGISEEIPGLHCPYCNSQGFRTDSPNIAVCGAAPGWFFFYRRLEQEKEPERTTKFIIKNGEMVEVDDEIMGEAKQKT